MENLSQIKNVNITGSISVNGAFYLNRPPSSKYCYIGAVAGYSKGMLENCHNQALIGISYNAIYAGGISEYSCGNINRCSNNGSISCDIVFGSIFAGGICGAKGEDSLINNCFNTGNISGVWAGGISGSTASVISNCYNNDHITGGESNSDKVGEITGSMYLEVKNCYYLSDKEELNSTGAIRKSAEQFASGEVTYLLNGGKSESDLNWYQNIDSDKLPVLDNTHSIVLYDGEKYCNEVIPSNKINAYMSRMFFNENSVQSKKITSLNQLKDLIDEQCDYDKILKEYDETFFNNKYIYLYHINDGSGNSEYVIDSVENTENLINIFVEQKTEGNTDDIVQWFLIAEIDKDLYDKDINVEFIELHDKSYPYKINEMIIFDINTDTPINNVPQNEGFYIGIDVNIDKDVFIIGALYDTDGKIIGIYPEKIQMSSG